MEDPNITMEEYIKLEEEKAFMCGKVYNWETATYGTIWYDDDVRDLKSVEIEFPAIVFNDELTSEEALSCEPTISSLNNNKIDFRILFDEFDDEDYTILTVTRAYGRFFDDLCFLKNFENEFSAIVYNDDLMSKSDSSTEHVEIPHRIDEFDLKTKTSLSKCDEEEQNVVYFNDLFPFNIIYPDDLEDQRHQYLRFEGLEYTDADIADFEMRIMPGKDLAGKEIDKDVIESCMSIMSLRVGNKSLLDAVGITAAQVCVNSAQLELVLLVNFNKKYTKCLLLLVEVKIANTKLMLLRKLILLMINYAMWEVIENGATLPKTHLVEGVMIKMPITTAKEKAQRRLEVNSRSTLMMGIFNKHQLKFNSIKDAKKLLEAVEKRFEMLDQTFDRLQKLVSQLELLEEKLSQKDVNQQLLRINTTHGVSTASTQVNAAYSTNIDNFSDAFICSFFSRQPYSPQLVYEDLEQIHLVDMEKMDMRWQMVMLTMRARKFLKKTRKKLTVNGNETIGFDKSNVECYNCHKRRHFARECRAPTNQDNKHKESSRRSTPVETSASIAFVSCDGFNGYDWREIAIRELKKKLEIAQKEKDGIQLNVDKFEHASKSLNKLIDCQILDNCKKRLGYENYNAVLPPYTGNFMPSTPNLSFTGLDEFLNKPVVEKCKAKSSKEETNVVRKNDDALIIKEYVSDNKEEDVSQPKIEKNSSGPDWLFDIDALTRTMNYEPIIADNGVSFDLNMPVLEDVSIFNFSSDDENDGIVADMNNLDITIQIEKEVYVCGPLGFKDTNFPDRVYKVEKAVYRLHQDPKAWYETLSTYLLDNGFQRGKIDKTLFIKWNRGDILLVQVYVDDIIFGSTKKELCNAFERLMHEKFLMSSMRELTFVLGLQFWSTAMATTINGEVQIHARVDGNEIVITESSVIRDLQLANEEGIDCLPNSSIFEQLALMSPKTTAWNKFSGTMASAIICLATNQKFNFSKWIFNGMIRNLDNMSGSTMPTDPHHTHTILQLSSSQPQKTQKPRKPKRKDTHVPHPSGPTDNVANEAVHKELGDSLVRVFTTASSLEAEQDSGAKKPWGILLLKLEQTKTTQKNEIDSLKRRAKKLEKKNMSRTHKLKRLYKVSLNARVESSRDEESLGDDASKQERRIDAIDADDEITRVNDADNEMFDVDDLGDEEVFVAEQEDKGKGIMIKEPVNPKKNDQIRLDKEAALKLQAEFDEEERLARERELKKNKKPILT
nr:putative ribonuclease H-like domain-containing protein [Tanacetum cinerariifolium]